MAKKVFEYQGKRRPKLHGFKKEFDIKVKDKDKVNVYSRKTQLNGC